MSFLGLGAIARPHGILASLLGVALVVGAATTLNNLGNAIGGRSGSSNTPTLGL